MELEKCSKSEGLKLRIETEDEVYENKYIFVAINNAKKVGRNNEIGQCPCRV